MISQAGCYLPGKSSPSEAFQERLSLPNLKFLEFQIFPDFSCTFPSPSIAAFNNCCLPTCTHSMSETSCHFLTHYSLLSSAEPSQGILEFLSVPGYRLPRAAQPAWLRWPCGRSAIRSEEFPVPPSFSEHANNDVFQPQALQVSHLPLPRVQRHRAQQSMPPGMPLHSFSSRPAAFPHSLHNPCRLHPFQRTHVESMTPYNPTEAPQPLHRVRV